MAENKTTVEASPSAVWSVLADAQTYGDWVVGAKEIRGTSGQWPEVGSVLHHTLGAGPAEIVKDRTEVTECQPQQHLRLRAMMRPLGIAEIIFDLIPQGSSTQVVMKERFVGGLLGRLYGVVMSGSIKARNVETLRRLSNLAQERQPGTS